jgi:hypothetical protein
MGDSCFVNMNGFMATPEGEKGEPLPNAASGDRVEVLLGPGRYMEGLVEGLDGLVLMRLATRSELGNLLPKASKYSSTRTKLASCSCVLCANKTSTLYRLPDFAPCLLSS